MLLVVRQMAGPIIIGGIKALVVADTANIGKYVPLVNALNDWWERATQPAPNFIHVKIEQAMEIFDFETMAIVSIEYTKDLKSGQIFQTTIGSNENDSDENLVQYVLNYLELNRSQVQNSNVVRISKEQYIKFLENQIKGYLC